MYRLSSLLPCNFAVGRLLSEHCTHECTWKRTKVGKSGLWGGKGGLADEEEEDQVAFRLLHTNTSSLAESVQRSRDCTIYSGAAHLAAYSPRSSRRRASFSLAPHRGSGLASTPSSQGAMAATPRWTEQDDLKLRLVLEEADGKASWGEVVKRAFPDGKHAKKDCQDVR